MWYGGGSFEKKGSFVGLVVESRWVLVARRV